MSTYINMNKQRIGQLNKRNVISCIQKSAPINRAAIAKKVGLSIPAVMAITDELQKHGMIQSLGRADSGVGKHPEMLTACGDHFRYIGVDVGRTTVRAVIAGHDGRVIASSKIPTLNFERESEFVDSICKLVRTTVADSGIDQSTIVGVCAAMPGLIEQDTGNVLFSPDFGWRDVPLQAWMSERLPYQVVVENANRAQARWETRPGSGNEDATVFCMGLGYGIGSAIIWRGEMYYGSSGTSGEVGHITVSPDGAHCSCGNIGCLEAMASGGALEEQAKALLRSGRATRLQVLSGGDLEKVDAKMVFQAAAAGDSEAVAMVDRAAKYIGIALAMAINMFDPDAIYLCGGMMKNGPDFLNRIIGYTRERQMHLAGRRVVISTGSQEDLNVALGATLMIQDKGYKFEALSFLY